MSDDENRNKGGRPRKNEAKVDYLELDRILVHGEEVPVEGVPDAKAVRYPSYQEIANRYGVSISVIGEYSSGRNCLRRRAEAQARLDAKVDQKIIEMRAEAIALSRTERIGLVDRALLAFAEALKDGRVRCDTSSDLNMLLRLREFLEGGADSRQQILGGITLEVLQSRHRQIMHMMDEASPGERGVEAADRARLLGDGGAIEEAVLLAPQDSPIAGGAGGERSTEAPGHDVHHGDEIQDAAGAEWTGSGERSRDVAEMRDVAERGTTPGAESPAAASSSARASSSSCEAEVP